MDLIEVKSFSRHLQEKLYQKLLRFVFQNKNYKPPYTTFDLEVRL